MTDPTTAASAPLRAAMLEVADALDGARSELGRLDGAAGDGDHGMTMSIAGRNLRKRLEALPGDAPPADLIRAAASSIGAVGGAIGPLYSAALTSIASDVEQQPAGAALDATMLRRAGEAALGAITGLGHAGPGDKTVVDALHPMVEALRAAEAGGADSASAASAAAGAAERGAAATADLIARIGRASRLGERSRGLPDAGATSLALIVRKLADAHARHVADGQ
jgi:dihydroxyacetone kinase